MSLMHLPRSVLFVTCACALAACAPQSYSARMDSGGAPSTGPAPAAPKAQSDGPKSDALRDGVQLKGLTPVQLRQVLGSPGFQRRDAPAEIWQYRGAGCTLDLFLYDGTGGQTVEHWAVRSPAKVADNDCLKQLVEQGQARAGS